MLKSDFWKVETEKEFREYVTATIFLLGRRLGKSRACEALGRIYARSGAGAWLKNWN